MRGLHTMLAPFAVPVRSLLFLACIGRACGVDFYVSYQQQSSATHPTARALSVAVLQHIVGGSAPLGLYLWLFGGLSMSTSSLRDLWMFDLQARAWTSITANGSIPTSRQAATAVLYQQDAFLFGGQTTSGGGTTTNPLNDMFVLHLGAPGVNPVWKSVTYNASSKVIPVARSHHTVVAATLAQFTNMPSGMILFGGVDQTGAALGDLYAFEFGASLWHSLSPSGTAPQKRQGHAACLLLNSLMALMGGSNQVIVPSYQSRIRDGSSRHSPNFPLGLLVLVLSSSSSLRAHN